MKTIVVIDLDGTLFRRISENYMPKGFNVVYCSTLLEALSVPASQIALLAIDPLALDEGEAISYIESLKMRNANAGVLLCSHKEDYDAMAEALSAGADDYIVAPYTGRMLEDHIDSML
ncbi:MAG: hypothetical protein K2I57_02160 [Muribaculaceae bacterium]|nr:hypothetical protein [Muribaculaceae bacterium]